MKKFFSMGSTNIDIVTTSTWQICDRRQRKEKPILKGKCRYHVIPTWQGRHSEKAKDHQRSFRKVTG